MPRKTGYLAAIDNIPPLIFRFQFNPDLLSEKKSYKYREANAFGKWKFDQTSAGTGIVGTLSGLLTDVKEIGSLLVATKPLEPEEGDQRSFSLDFALDATHPGARKCDPHEDVQEILEEYERGSRRRQRNGLDEDHYHGSIEPDLAVLRSFMNPSWDLIDVTKMVVSGFKDVPCLSKPPQCTLVYGDVSITCVMTDLNIKVTSFKYDGSPARADVSVTLKEQTFSFSPLTELIKRQVNVAKSYDRKGIGKDFMSVTPILSLFS